MLFDPSITLSIDQLLRGRSPHIVTSPRAPPLSAPRTSSMYTRARPKAPASRRLPSAPAPHPSPLTCPQLWRARRGQARAAGRDRAGRDRRVRRAVVLAGRAARHRASAARVGRGRRDGAVGSRVPQLRWQRCAEQPGALTYVCLAESRDPRWSPPDLALTSPWLASCSPPVVARRPSPALTPITGAHGRDRARSRLGLGLAADGRPHGRGEHGVLADAP